MSWIALPTAIRRWDRDELLYFLYFVDPITFEQYVHRPLEDIQLVVLQKILRHKRSSRLLSDFSLFSAWYRRRYGESIEKVRAAYDLCLQLSSVR